MDSFLQFAVGVGFEPTRGSWLKHKNPVVNPGLSCERLYA